MAEVEYLTNLRPWESQARRAAGATHYQALSKKQMLHVREVKQGGLQTSTIPSRLGDHIICMLCGTNKRGGPRL
jgi:hypothetical protein